MAEPRLEPWSNKIQNGDNLVPGNQGPAGKWPLKWRKTESDYNMMYFSFAVSMLDYTGKLSVYYYSQWCR